MNPTLITYCCAIFLLFSFSVSGQETSSLKQSQAKLRNTQGLQYVKEYRFTKAITKFTEAIALDNQPIYAVNRANAYLEFDKLDKAKLDFVKATKIDSTLGLAYLGVSKCMIIEDINNDSLNWYLDQALRFCNKNEDQTLSLTTLAELKMAEGNYTLAEKYIERAQALDPTNLYTSSVYASISFELNETERAVRLLEQIVEEDPNNMRYLINLGYLYNSVERYDDAMKVLDRGLFYQPDNPYVLANMGYSLFMKRRLGDAEKAVDRSIKNDQSNAYGHYVKGLLEMDGKNIPKACRCFNRALDRTPLNVDRSFREIKEAVNTHCESTNGIN